MAKKRRTRRKAKRSLKKRKSRSKSRSKSRRRRNPAGNFKLPTPRQSMNYLKAWERKKDADGKPVTKATQIKLSDERETKLAQNRFREALRIRKLYLEDVAKFEAKKAEFDAYKQQGVKKVDGITIAKWLGKKPNIDGKVRDKSGRWGGATGGNFAKISEKQAKSYLRRHFGWTNVTSGRSHGLQSHQYPFTPRMQECVEVLGLETALNIVSSAKENRENRRVKKLESDLKKAEKRVGTKASKISSIEKQLDKARADHAKAVDERDAIKAAKPAAKKAKKETAEAAKRHFRRNPARPFRPKKRRYRRLKRKSKRKARKSMKRRGRKKARKSKRKSRRARRR